APRRMRRRRLPVLGGGSVRATSTSSTRRDGVASSFHRSKICDHVLDLLRGQNRLAGEFRPHPIKAVDPIEGGHRRAVAEYLLCIDDNHAQARGIPTAGHAI